MSDEKKIQTDSKIRDVYRLCKEKGIPFEICEESFIDQNTTGNTHAGLIAIVGDRKYISKEEMFKKKNGFIFLLDGIEDPYNFSYAVRSMYAAGADGMIMWERNWMSAVGVCIRGSGGATELIDCAIADAKDKLSLINCAKDNGYNIVVAHEKGTNLYCESLLKRPLFLVIGGEKRGVSREILAGCNSKVRIDYGRDFKMSLTSASCASILAFEVFRQNKN